MRFADDMALLAEEEMILMDMLLELNDSYEQYGMKINANKTTMIVRRKIKKFTNQIIYGLEGIESDARCKRFSFSLHISMAFQNILNTWNLHRYNLKDAIGVIDSLLQKQVPWVKSSH
ncbi:hypothetical protein ANN_19553 [Periplaneta americana]|uniref:Reverse transcriptase domain-containing protein n=1 Tax=Periplaneta americana TaxID=6978 RepID=A0ABQ8SAF4_PERAM|nr:hypothetical protein ANN_19553 [Periplaneta americana]